MTQILTAVSAGEEGAADRLLEIVYEELRTLARQRLARESPGLTLQPTALVHEAYLRLIGNADARWENRGHFFAAAAEAMRRILIERARKYRNPKHGGGRKRVLLEGVDAAQEPPSPDLLLALDEALQKLEQRDARMSETVKLRFFAGLSTEQIAEALGVSRRTIERAWVAARTWLWREMTRQGEEACGP